MSLDSQTALLAKVVRRRLIVAVRYGQWAESENAC